MGTKPAKQKSRTGINAQMQMHGRRVSAGKGVSTPHPCTRTARVVCQSDLADGVGRFERPNFPTWGNPKKIKEIQKGIDVEWVV